MRRAWFLAAACLIGSAQAQSASEERAGWELGVRYWLSTGETKSSHDASSSDCLTGIPCGNPTSTLTYDRLDANTIELYARKGFGERWFVKGNVGLGSVA